MNAVTMEGLTKRFGDDTAVDGITLAVAPGTIVGDHRAVRRGQDDARAADDRRPCPDRG